MTGIIDEAWHRAVSMADDVHTTRITATRDVTLRSLDWERVVAGGVPEQTWVTGLGPGEHTVAVTTTVMGPPTRFTNGGTADFLLVGDLRGESPEWRRIEDDLPFRRGVAVVPDLQHGTRTEPRGDRTAWTQFLRTLQTFTLDDGRTMQIAFAAVGTALLEKEIEGKRAVAVTPAAALSGPPSRTVATSELVTHGLAGRWEGLRGGRVVAVALDTGSALRRTLEGLRAVDDPWTDRVGAGLPCGEDDAGAEPDYGADYERMPYSDAFVPGKHVSDQAVTVALGDIRFPSGIVTIVSPMSADLASDLMLSFPTDRAFPCFVAPTVQHNGDLLVRTGDAKPSSWRLAALRQRGAGSGRPRGLIALCDRTFAERLQGDAAFAGRISELAVSLNPLLVHDAASGEAVGVVISTEGNLDVRPVLGLTEEGSVVAIALEAADAADISMWS